MVTSATKNGVRILPRFKGTLIKGLSSRQLTSFFWCVFFFVFACLVGVMNIVKVLVFLALFTKTEAFDCFFFCFAALKSF